MYPQTFQSTRPATPIPLRRLRLLEPYQYRLLIEQTLPAFAGLPRLESLALIVWRDRNFGPDIFTRIAMIAPHLRELTLGLENEHLNWWPGSMTDYSTSLASLENLEVLSWNYSPVSVAWSDADLP